MFSSSQKKDRLELIVDIQSSVVRGSLVEMSSKVRVIWTKSVIIPYRPHGGSAYLIKMAVRAVEEISSESAVASQGKIFAVHCILASPWIVSRAMTVSQSFSKDTKVTRAMIAGIIKAERERMVGKPSDSLMSIEEKIFDVRLNGYSIAGWEDNTAKSLDVSFAVSLAGERMIQRFKEASQRALPLDGVRFHSSLLLQQSGMALAADMPESYMLVHIHGELTDLVVVERGSCAVFGSQPIGTMTVIRKAAHSLKISNIAADSYLTLREGGQLDASHSNAKANAAVEHIATAWAAECSKLIALAPKSSSIKHAVVSSRFHEVFFIDSFKKAYPNVSVKHLPVDEIFHAVSFEGHAEKLRLTALYAIALKSMESI